MLDWPLEIVVPTVAVICGVLSVLAYYKNVLNKEGAATAFGVGFVIGVFGHIMWLILLLLFLVTSFAATRYRFSLKEKRGVQEGVKGERGGANVIANGLIPAAIAFIPLITESMELAYFTIEQTGLIFVSAISVAAADTLASEIGVLSDKTYLITTLRRVPAGTNGGVSWLGHLFALAASTYTAVMGWIFLAFLTPTMPQNPAVIVIPLVIGFVGCQIDSIFGATLEARGWLTKKTNNLLTVSIGAVLTWFVVNSNFYEWLMAISL
ncbi:MAG: TIGR00297 family protein [Thermoplasmata archaeon]